MTIRYPDISSFQAGMSLAGLSAVCIKATEGTTYTDPYYRGWISAASGPKLRFAYHFLHAGNAAGQARYCHSVVGSTPVMIDCEPTSGATRAARSHVGLGAELPVGATSSPTVADCVAFADELRSLGTPCTLVYYPKWYAGSASLAALRSAGLALVSSSYTTYSDSGPGWAAYGGVSPSVWQYADNASVGGRSVDMNAYRGSLDELTALVMGDDMALSADDIEKVALAVWEYTHKVGGKSTEPGGRDVHQALDNAAASAGNAASGVAALTKQVAALETTVAKLQAPTGPSAADVAAEIIKQLGGTSS